MCDLRQKRKLIQAQVTTPSILFMYTTKVCSQMYHGIVIVNDTAESILNPGYRQILQINASSTDC